VPDTNPTTTTDVLQTVFIGLQFLVLIAAAVFGRRQLNEAKELREAQTRPFVVIDLGSSAHTLFDLVVKNIGTTLARDVRFAFSPPIKSTDDDLDPNKIKMFREGISTLAPGKEIRTLFEKGPDRHASELPDTYEVTVSYTDQTGKRKYEEKIDLDFGLYWDRLTVTRRGVHDLHKQLETIAKEIRRWRPNIGRGVLTVTAADVRERNAEALERLEEHRAEQAKGDQAASEEGEQ
jgi:hypothetical protein